MQKILLRILVLLLPLPVSANDLVINEFMAHNDSVLTDGAGDYVDWIELYNPTDSVVNLQGWALNDGANQSRKWTFPAVNLGPGQYLLVYASAKSPTALDGGLHTNFVLPKAGGYLALVRPDNSIAHQYDPYPSQLGDYSYGLLPSLVLTPHDPSHSRQLATATPGAANSGPRTPAIDASVSSRYFENPFVVELSSPYLNDTLRYTLNGLDPNVSSSVYSGPILINAKTVLKVRSFFAGGGQSEVAVFRYYFLHGNLSAFDSDLALLLIDTDGTGIGEGGQTASFISIIEPDSTGRAAPRDAPAFSGRAAFKVRGSSSAAWPKKQFSMELWDENDQDKAASLLGMPEEADWVLYGPGRYDRARINNLFMFELSRRMGYYAPRTRFVEVYLNTDGGDLQSADYWGLYILVESIKRDPNRTPVAKLGATDNALPAVDGGYILSVDRSYEGQPLWTTTHQNDLNHVYPKWDQITPQQQSYIRSYVQAFDDALYGSQWTDPEQGYARYFDVAPSIDYHIVKAMAHEVDMLRLSTYFYKDRGGKLTYGIPWDYDRALNSWDGRDDNPEGWSYYRTYNWWDRLFDDPNFDQQWWDRWFELRQSHLSTPSLNALIDSCAALMAEAAPREEARWLPVGNYEYRYGGFAQEIQALKNWLQQRCEWIDGQFIPPPDFSQKGGAIGLGDSLGMSNPYGAGTIYYSLNGTDVRGAGGVRAPGSWGYVDSVAMNGTVIEVQARIGLTQTDANIARFKSTRQSSTQGTAQAQRAVDGNTDGDAINASVSQTDSTYRPWWEVDLQGPFFVKSVKLYSRTDCCALSDYYVLFSREPFSSDTLDTLLNDPLVQAVYQSGPVTTPATISFNDTARFVRVQLAGTKALNLAEVQVLADVQQWGGLRKARFYTPQDFSGLVINEIHYHPADTCGAEFIELKNGGTQALDLSDVSFRKGLDYRFPLGTTLEPDSFLVLAQNVDSFYVNYGFLPFAAYTGKLDNGGETLLLVDPLGVTLDSVRYMDTAPWDLRADGQGPSLELVSSELDNSLALYWRVSPGQCGTPARENSVICASLPPTLKVTELMYNYGFPLDGLDAQDWIELYNPHPFAVDLSSWALRDEDSLFVLPLGTSIAAEGFLVLTDSLADFLSVHPGLTQVIGLPGLQLSSKGESLALFNDVGCPSFLFSYDNNAPWPEDADGKGFSLLLTDPALDPDDPAHWASSCNYGGTPGLPNLITCSPIPNTPYTPIVLNEISYRPNLALNTEDWVELYNPNAYPVDISGWELHDGNNYWTLPPGTILPAEGYWVLAQNLSSFQAIFPWVSNVSGNWGFGLSGDGEWVALLTNERCWVDGLKYNDSAPWPLEADGQGPTLALIDPTLDNAIAGNWAPSNWGNAPVGTPGAANNIPAPCLPLPPPVVMTEIHYRSDASYDTGNWLELYNPADTAIDLSGWFLMDEDSAYFLSGGTMLPAHSYLVLAEEADNDSLLAHMSALGAALPIGSTHLNFNNGGERLRLYSASRCLIDSLRYDNQAPWPVSSGDATTISLLSPAADNSRGENWALSDLKGTPGAPNEITCSPAEGLNALRLWLRADSLFADGAAVSQWPDQSPSQTFVAQDDPAQQPLFRAGQINGWGTVHWDGADDYFSMNELADAFHGSATTLLVLRPEADTAFAEYLQLRAGNQTGLGLGNTRNGQLTYSSPDALISHDDYRGQPVLLRVERQWSGNMASWIQGTSGNPGTTTNIPLVDSVDLGRRQSPARLTYWLEAELATVGSHFDVIVEPGASGGKYVAVKSGLNSTASAPPDSADRIRFTFAVDFAGDYRLWGRVQAPSGTNDSFWVRANGGTWVKWDDIQASSSWTWDEVHDSDQSGQVITVRLSEGNNTLDLAYREEGALLDKLYLSRGNPLIAPVEMGQEADNLSEATLQSSLNQVNYARWEGISGISVADLTGNANYPFSPSYTATVSLFESPTNILDNYGVRIWGYVQAPQTGNYTFWVAGDDNVQLWLSSDTDPANKVQIAYHNSWTSSREWTKFSSQASAPIALQAGEWYYLEALMKEAGGGDNLAVGWQLPDGSLDRPISGTYLKAVDWGSPAVQDTTITSFWKGGIAEMIVLAEVPEVATTAEIEAYLALKYGLSLPPAQHPYYDHQSHPYQQLGLMTDLKRCWTQQQSRNQEGGILTLSCPEPLLQGHSVVIGHEGSSASQAAASHNVPPGWENRMARVWRVSEKGETGRLEIRFDTTGLGWGQIDPRAWSLLVDTDGDFSDASSYAPVDSTLRFQVDLADGQYLSLGRKRYSRVQVRAILSGAYTFGNQLMRDDLRSQSLLPAADPYLGAWNLEPALLNLNGPRALVDWVLLELRNDKDSTEVLHQQAFLLQRDGQLVDPGGDTVLFLDYPPGSYFLSLRHRNHLGVMTLSSYTLAPTPSTIDLRSAPTYGNDAQKLLAPGVYGLWAGDANGDGRVIFQGIGNDPGAVFLRVLSDGGNLSFQRNYVVTAYHPADTDLSGKVIFQGIGADTNPVFLNVLSHPENQGFFNRNFLLRVQLP